AERARGAQRRRRGGVHARDRRRRASLFAGAIAALLAKAGTDSRGRALFLAELHRAVVRSRGETSVAVADAHLRAAVRGARNQAAGNRVHLIAIAGRTRPRE